MLTPQCPRCQVGLMLPDVRDVEVKYGSRSAIVPSIKQRFCTLCNEAGYFTSSDSAERYEKALDLLIIKSRLDKNPQ